MLSFTQSVTFSSVITFLSLLIVSALMWPVGLWTSFSVALCSCHKRRPAGKSKLLLLFSFSFFFFFCWQQGWETVGAGPQFQKGSKLSFKWNWYFNIKRRFKISVRKKISFVDYQMILSTASKKQKAKTLHLKFINILLYCAVKKKKSPST